MEAYRSAWEIFFNDEHLERVMRRAYACGISLRSLMPVLFWFASAMPVENLHPLQWGIFRIKRRRDRRAGLPLEPPIAFYVRYAADVARKTVALAGRWRRLKRIKQRIEADPNAKLYRDGALTPVAEEDAEHMDLYTQNEAARVAVARERRVAGKNGSPSQGYERNGRDPAHRHQPLGQREILSAELTAPPN
jgi:hypothetical protein